MQCQAAIADGKGHFVIDAIEIQPPQGDEVLIEIKAAGICHTDWDSQSWGKALVMGHEGAGIVAACGPKVSTLSLGDPVMLNWAIPCYKCFQCLEGNQHLCERNSAVTAGNKISGGHATFSSTTYQGQAIERAFSLGTMAEFALVRAYCDAGDEIVTAWRSYEAYPIIAGLSGARLVEVPLDGDHRLDAASFRAAVGSRTKAVLICNPNNPTGTALAPDALDGVLDAMPTDILIILDEAYCDYDGSAEAVAASPEQRRA